MTDNILENQILCTCGEYLDEVYGARTKPFRDAVLHVFDAIVTGSSTLVSDLSRTLRLDASCAEAKRTQELVSRWLEHYDFTSAANPHLLGGAASHASDATASATARRRLGDGPRDARLLVGRAFARKTTGRTPQLPQREARNARFRLP